MSALEARYRRALRWYPTRWRERHEEVILSTLLDVADAEGRTTPGRGELWNLAATGTATRASVLLPVELRDLIATVSIATGAVLATVFTVVYSWAPWAEAVPWFPGVFPPFGPFTNPGPLVYGLWPIAFALSLLRRPAVMRWVLGLALIAAPLLRLANWAQGDLWSGPMTTTLSIFMLLALGALLGTPHRGMRMLVAVGFAAGVASVIIAATGSIRQYDVWERAFWMTHNSPLEWIVLSMLATAVALGIVRKPGHARFTIVLVSPWLLVLVIAAIRSDPASAIGVALVGAGLIAAASLVALAVRRSREATPRRSA